MDFFKKVVGFVKKNPALSVGVVAVSYPLARSMPPAMNFLAAELAPVVIPSLIFALVRTCYYRSVVGLQGSMDGRSGRSRWD
jgi:hypothetical protein